MGAAPKMADPSQSDAPDAGPEDPHVGRVLSGKFRVERVLGQGGMGAVYVAHHEYTKRRGALKLLLHRLAESPDIVERFVREASAAGLIDDPHIVHTYDAGMLETGEPYLFMELLDGQSLEDLLEARETLHVAEALAIARQAATALAAAHDAAIVHRDIKPANLFLVRGDTPFVKLLDFGISKFAPASDDEAMLTTDGQLLGTPMYMSPEQVRGSLDIDGRTDVFSLGAVLYEMLAGVQPFFGNSVMEISVRVSEGKFRPLSELRSDLPLGLDPLLARVLSVDREQRPSARALSAELGALLAGTRDLALVESGTLPSRRAAPTTERAAEAALAQTLPSDASALSPVVEENVSAGASVVEPTGTSRRPVKWLALAVLLVAVAVALWLARGSSRPAELDVAAPAVEPGTPQAERAAPREAQAEPAPSAAPEPSPREAAPDPQRESAPPERANDAPTPAKAKKDEPSRSPVKPRAPSSAAAEDGLTQDNPFE